jgi:hypothetical protein
MHYVCTDMYFPTCPGWQHTALESHEHHDCAQVYFPVHLGQHHTALESKNSLWKPFALTEV